MAGKSSSNEKPIWRPLAHKLSSLIPLRRLNKAKSKADVRSDEAAQSNASSDFRLDVQLNGLESLRLPSSWLLQPKDADKQNQQLVDASAGSKISHPDTRRHLDRHESTRPLTYIDISNHADTQQARASALEALTNPGASILDRGRPVEARHLIHQPVKTLKNHRKSLPLDLETMYQASNPDHDANSLRTATIRLVPNETLIASPSVKESPRLTAAREREAQLAMPPPPRPLSTVANESAPAASPARTLQIPRNGQLALKRPTSLGPPATKAGGSTPTDTADSPLLARANSKRPGALSDRLAWIKKLEEKDNSKPNNDLTVLQKRAGSVSDKLAMFEKKNLSVTSASSKRLQAPARNPSSQYSASVRESIFSADGSAYAPSPRTSMDTTRTSSVMSYYDDSFREKLESIVGQEPETTKQTE
ncbi:hypothetical protein IL306_000358 [Fusarium sp. DS 682]|nr:hypothetical protein IL306_000358 [Fusarium sp. DS 682]